MTQEIVIDTNVPIVANGETPQADLQCVHVCSQVLERVCNGELRVLLDNKGLILEEYLKGLKSDKNRKQKGLGMTFLIWLWNKQAVESRCRKIVINPSETRTFEEFPDDPALDKFDLDDRKFVAVSCASKTTAEILNASDTDWSQYEDALDRHDVTVVFLCLELMSID